MSFPQKVVGSSLAQKVVGSSLEKSVYPQTIDFQKNHTELTGYAEVWTSVKNHKTGRSSRATDFMKKQSKSAKRNITS